MHDEICFYSVSDSYGEFSNFARFAIHMDGKRWPTNEHYFQAMKFEDPERREKMRRARTPAIAACKGRDRKHRIRRDWQSAKLDVMRRASTRASTSGFAHQPLGLYVVYEAGVSANTNIRVDLLLIYPSMALAAAMALRRSADPPSTTQ